MQVIVIIINYYKDYKISFKYNEIFHEVHGIAFETTQSNKYSYIHIYSAWLLHACMDACMHG